MRKGQKDINPKLSEFEFYAQTIGCVCTCELFKLTLHIQINTEL